MYELHHPFRRPQLLTKRAALLLLGLSAAGCDASAPGFDAGPSVDAGSVDAGSVDASSFDAGSFDAGTDAGIVPERHAEAVEDALTYLETTGDEFGLDVVVAIQIYATQRDSVRASEVAERRRLSLRPSDVERYGVLLDLAKPPFPAVELGGATASSTTPDPMDELLDDRVTRCLDEVLTCDVSPECIAYVELEDRWGYVLTHQAVTLLFAQWTGCDLALDVDGRRRTLAANLIAAMVADPGPSDLALERIAMLGYLGFGAEIEPGWIEGQLAAQQGNGCLPVSVGGECHPHPTGLLLWALAAAPR